MCCGHGGSVFATSNATCGSRASSSSRTSVALQARGSIIRIRSSSPFRLVPQHLEEEMAGAVRYYAQTGVCVFCDVAEQEIAGAQRVIEADADSIAFTPFASRVPFETWVVPREHHAAFDSSSDQELRAIAGRLRDVMRRLDATLLTPPYTLLLHTAPVGRRPASRFTGTSGAPRGCRR